MSENFKLSLSCRISTQKPTRNYLSCPACHMPSPPHSPWFDHSSNMRRGVNLMKLLAVNCLQPATTSSLLDPSNFPAPYYRHFCNYQHKFSLKKNRTAENEQTVSRAITYSTRQMRWSFFHKHIFYSRPKRNKITEHESQEQPMTRNR